MVKGESGSVKRRPAAGARSASACRITGAASPGARRGEREGAARRAGRRGAASGKARRGEREGAARRAGGRGAASGKQIATQARRSSSAVAPDTDRKPVLGRLSPARNPGSTRSPSDSQTARRRPASKSRHAARAGSARSRRLRPPPRAPRGRGKPVAFRVPVADTAHQASIIGRVSPALDQRFAPAPSCRTGGAAFRFLARQFPRQHGSP